MQIWIDADACPAVIKDILFRAAIRTKTKLVLVANQIISTPASPFIRRIQVASGFDVADHYIENNIQPEDLVITADIPLADLVIDKGGIALNPRGELYSKENIKQRLAIRNFNEELRGTGVSTGGPPKISKREIENFANSLDRLLTQYKQRDNKK